MKKFISMTMAAIMAASIVPSTAFAAEANKITTVGEIEWSVDEAKNKPVIEDVELQITLKDEFNHSFSNTNEVFEFELDFENAEAGLDSGCFPNAGIGLYRNGTKLTDVIKINVEDYDKKDSHFEFTVTEQDANLLEGDMIVITFNNFNMTKYSKDTEATVNVSGDFGEAKDLLLAGVYGNVLTLEYDDELVEVAEEDYKEVKDITIEPKVGKFATGDEIKVKINSDFEIMSITNDMITGGTLKTDSWKENEFVIITENVEEIEISDMVIEALDSAKPGDIGTITVRCKDYESASINVIKVVADEIKVTVDEDEDIPVMYSGVDNEFNDENHDALTVTIEEVTIGSWDTKDAWSLTLPEGVYVTDKIKINSWNVEPNYDRYGYYSAPVMFMDAYSNENRGNFESFEFPRYSFSVTKDEKAKIEFTLNLIAEPGFEGDVDLTFDNGEFKKTVTIAKFVKPYNIEVKQNDVAVDYRYTALESGIIVTEPEEGLWVDGTTFDFKVEKDYIKFENTEKYISNFDVKENSKSTVGFTVKEQSDEEPFKVEIKDLSVYMDRNLPAGGYDLEVLTSIDDKLFEEKLLSKDNKTYDDVIDKDKIVIENFINIVTGDADTFVTKVEVPVGKNYIKAGDKVFTLDVPAYINAENYTMLPVRAVALALGIDNDAIIWNAEAHTATIFYGSRIISMTVGADVMTVNGTTIPTATSVEVVNGRMFIPMRDLATAMNAKLDWDPVIRTAYFN